jgi:hypothetical protein
MLAFRNGEWISVELPFSDPALSRAHKMYATAVAATELSRGVSLQKAVTLAETRVYERMYPGSAGAVQSSPLRVTREKHNAPKDYKK